MRYIRFFRIKEIITVLFCLSLIACSQNSQKQAVNTNSQSINQISKEERLLQLVDGEILDTTVGETEKPTDLIEFESLIKDGVNINVRDKKTFKTPVMIAVQTNRITTLRLLLEASANPNLQDNDGQTALMTAANYNSVVMVRLLLKHGAKTGIKDNKGNTALTSSQYIGDGEKYLEPQEKAEYLEIQNLLKSHK